MDEVKNQYTIERGTHYSTGKKRQPLLFPLAVLLAGILWMAFFTVPHGLMPVVFTVSLIIFAFYYHRESRDVMNIRMRVRFQNGCLYHMDSPKDSDVNKLFGVGFGNHLKYSGRFGWNSIEGGIHIYGYVRNNGAIRWDRIMSCPQNESVDMMLHIADEHYCFTVYRDNGEIHRLNMPRIRNRLYDLLPYRLYPYFGGTSVAPQDMTIFMEEVG